MPRTAAFPLVGAGMDGGMAWTMYSLGSHRRRGRDFPRQSDRSKFFELAGARSCGAGQHRAGFSGNQQELQPVIFGKRSLGNRGEMFSIIARSLRSGVLTERNPFGSQASFGFPVIDFTR